MFYVLIFSLAAVLLVFAFISTMTRRRRDLAREEGYDTHVSYGEAHAGHRDDTSGKNRKAKRAQSQHDRRKRH